jgi:hypothetical protein
MRQKRQQAMPFGWILAVLTGVGVAGGVGTGLYANAMRTADALPMDEAQAFEITDSVSVVQETPKAEMSPEAQEDFALFSPVLSFPSASHPPAVAIDQSGSAPTMVLASLAPQTAPEQVAPEVEIKPVPMPPVRHVSTGRPGGVLNDAQIASIKKRLKLTPDQESLWPAVEVALRNINYVPKARELKVASVHSSSPMAYVDPDSNEVQRLKYAAIPLIMRLNEDQKQEVRSMAHVMGLESVASSF